MNPYKKLLGLLPNLGRTDVGTVIAIDEGGVTIQLQMGGVLHIRGTATLGSRVYIKNGAIVGPAPIMTGVDIDV